MNSQAFAFAACALLFLAQSISRATAAAVNDFFTNRTEIAGAPLVVSGSNRDSTLEANEPPTIYELSSVWYAWSAPSNGSVRMSVTSSNFWPVLRVFHGTLLRELESELFIFGKGTNRFEARAGTEYYVRISGNAPVPFPPPEGDFVFTLDYDPPPPNDEFAGRILLQGAEVSVTASTISASHQLGEPDHGPLRGAHSIWYSWRASNSGMLGVRVEPGYYPDVVFYIGESLASLVPVGLNMHPGGRGVCCFSLPVTSNTVYHIAVDAEYRDTAAFDLALKLAPPPQLIGTRKAEDSIRFDLGSEWIGYYVIESSSDLTTWAPVLTNFTLWRPETHIFPRTYPARFFRIHFPPWGDPNL